MRRQYQKPQLVEYGRIDALTLGSSGGQPDFVIQGIQLITNPTNPTCTTNGGTTYACLSTYS